MLEKIRKSTHPSAPEVSQVWLPLVSELLYSLRTRVLAHLPRNMQGQTFVTGLILSQLLLTCLAGICTGNAKYYRYVRAETKLEVRGEQWFRVASYKWLCMLSRLICVQLFATLWTIVHHAPLSMVFSRQEY